MPTAQEKLAAFGLKVLKAARTDGGCDLDGGQLQDMAVATGVLGKRTVTVPCCPTCDCVAFGADFPVECFFTDPEIVPLMKD